MVGVRSYPWAKMTIGGNGGLEIAGAGFFAVYWNSTVAISTETSLNYASIRDQIAGFVGNFGNVNNYAQNNTGNRGGGH